MTPPDKLQILNAHPRDVNISFQDEGHIYTVCGERGTYTSVTTFVHHNFPTFDSDKIADNLVKSGKTADPTSKYFGLTKQQIKAQWAKSGKEASSSGTKMHYDIECYSNDLPIDNDSQEFQYFRQFREDFAHLVPYRTEWMIYSEEEKLSGSIDMVYFDTQTNEYVIADWKRTKGIEYDTNWGKYGLTEFTKHLPDTNFWHYSLQLNTYKKILETKYGLTIGKMFLMCLHPDCSGYEKVDVNPMPYEMEGLFAERRRMFAKPTEEPNGEVIKPETDPEPPTQPKKMTTRSSKKIDEFFTKKVNA